MSGPHESDKCVRIDDRHTPTPLRASSRDISTRSHDDLAGRGRTAVRPDKAMRARDLDRPTAEELARADTDLTIVRRNWTPPPSSGRGRESGR